MEIMSDSVYEHDEFGEVLVTSIRTVYDRYETVTYSGDKISTDVVFYTDWDGYGPFHHEKCLEDVTTFKNMATYKHEYRE